MLTIHRIVHPAHLFCRDLPAQLRQSLLNFRMQRQCLPADDGYGFIGRKISAIIFEHGKIECGDQAVGRIAGHQIHLLLAQRSIQEAQVHSPGSSGKLQAVGLSESLEPVRAFHEFVPEPSPPARRVAGRFRDRMQLQPARVFSADHNGERVLKT